MSLYINVGLSAEVELNAEQIGAGVGLYRTEIPLCYASVFLQNKSK